MPPALTPALERFFADPGPTPCVGIDLSVVADRYLALALALPGVELFYAVKANPDAAILAVLHGLGASFDVASPGEIELCRSVGATGVQMSFGNTIKTRVSVADAAAQGVELFSFDTPEELDKHVIHAPGSVAMCRLISDGAGAAWPLSRKFGCPAHEAEELLLAAADAGLRPGICFHVGSQQLDARAWDPLLAQVAELANRLERRGHHLGVVNLGGGFPSAYLADPMPIAEFGATIMASVEHHLGGSGIRLMAEPGRAVVASAGVLVSTVVRASTRGDQVRIRWIYLDAGLFSGLIETLDEVIRYPVLTSRPPGGHTAPSVLAGPTCDSLDILTEGTPVDLPEALTEGDLVALTGAGAYTTSYSSIAFNGFPPLRQVVV